MFNGHRFLSRQKEKAREGHGGWSEGEGGRTLKDQRMKKENRKEKRQKHSIKIKRGAVGGKNWELVKGRDEVSTSSTQSDAMHFWVTEAPTQSRFVPAPGQKQQNAPPLDSAISAVSQA